MFSLPRLFINQISDECLKCVSRNDIRFRYLCTYVGQAGIVMLKRRRDVGGIQMKLVCFEGAQNFVCASAANILHSEDMNVRLCIMSDIVLLEL